jgi:hypothetical protein
MIKTAYFNSLCSHVHPRTFSRNRKLGYFYERRAGHITEYKVADVIIMKE